MGQLLTLRAGQTTRAAEGEIQGHSDDVLMALAREGDKAAFDQIVRRHQAKAHRVARRQLGPNLASLAPDIAQDAFVEVYRSLSVYQPRGKFQAYLFGVLLNRCRMVRRSARYEARARQTSEQRRVEDHNAEAGALARERRDSVEVALERLSDKVRATVVLRYAADMTYQEIADVLDVPLGTVKRRLYDGLEKLRRLMERP